MCVHDVCVMCDVMTEKPRPLIVYGRLVNQCVRCSFAPDCGGWLLAE